MARVELASLVVHATTMPGLTTLWFHSRMGIWSTKVLPRAKVELGHLVISKS